MSDFKTPYFLIDENKILHNLKILKSVSAQSGCKILLAQKAFSMYYAYPLLAEYLDGTTASGLYEARLGFTCFGKETHVFSPAYREDEFSELLKYADTLVFNTPNQVRKFGSQAKEQGKFIALRINPECSTQTGRDMYDPCGFASRLGTTVANFDVDLLPLLDGLHLHTLCEQNADDLETTVQGMEEKFGTYLKAMKWLNLGGGHHITREDYDISRLLRIIKYLQERYELQVYLEPGEAVVLNAGFLHTTVLEIMNNQMEIAILDTSAACHMPDVIEMPYQPPLQNSGKAGTLPYTYRLGGMTCLAGDIIGDYGFQAPLKIGDELIFADMALYTMVKTNTFNGMPLPAILWKNIDGKIVTVKLFDYEDFKGRL
ncbi:MAG: carboxynorspermidine decarboxylase [Lachnospiraceae bacterium]|nr:carboxynorspermidine decarboxylase [Lachnospiraceae bacterium]